MNDQPELPLPAPPINGDQPLVPARMVNEQVYCPRLAYLMWVEGEWGDTGDTEDGRRVHTRIDRKADALPDPGEEPPPFEARSVTLSSETLGVIAKFDLVEGEGRTAIPVDTKRGKRPHVAAGAYDPERVQLCLQAILLEEYGYTVEEAAIWYAASRERVRIALDDDLRAQTLRAVSDLRLAAASGRRPPPLEDSTKCPRCALAGICLPDETNFFRKGHVPRPLNPADDPALPLHVQTPGAKVRKSGESLVIEADGSETEVPLIHVSELAVYGPVSVTTPALYALMRADIPVSWHSTGGWLMGHTVGTGPKHPMARAAQFRVAADKQASLRLAAGLVEAKIRNQRTILRRNWKGEVATRDSILERLLHLARKTPAIGNAQSLLGIEGEAAALYFGAFERMIVAEKTSLRGFGFTARNRRPPTDPVNALLSFAYALAVRVFTEGLATVGLDPYQGVYHRPRPGRPSLSLDMMEPFRPVLCDSTVLTVINNGEIDVGDFVFNGLSCALKPGGRRKLIAAWERRLAQETTHPLFGYRIGMRRLIAVQCRLLARHLAGELDRMPHYIPR